MNRDKPCACGGELRFVKREYLQLGKTGWITGEWPNLLAGALDVEIWCCPDCGELKFYRGADWDEAGSDHMAQTTCPACGAQHDLDDPKCPFCGAKNPSI